MDRRSFLVGAAALMVSATVVPKPKELSLDAGLWAFDPGAGDDRTVFIDVGNEIYNSGSSPIMFRVLGVGQDGKLITETVKYDPARFAIRN